MNGIEDRLRALESSADIPALGPRVRSMVEREASARALDAAEVIAEAERQLSRYVAVGYEAWVNELAAEQGTTVDELVRDATASMGGADGMTDVTNISSDDVTDDDPVFLLAKLAMARLAIIRAGVPEGLFWELPTDRRGAILEEHYDALRGAVARLGLPEGTMAWADAAGPGNAAQLRRELQAILPRRTAT